MTGTWPNLDASDLETRVRTYLNETTADFYTQADIWRWLSVGAKDIAQKALCIRRFIDAQTTSGTRTVSFLAYKVIHVEYVPSSGRPLMLTKIDPLKVGHYITNATTPQFWYEFGSTIGIDPLPDATYNLRLYIADIPKMAVISVSDFTSGWTAGTGWTATTSAPHTGSSSGDLTYSTATMAASTNHTIVFVVSSVGTGGTVTPYLGTTAGVAVTTNGCHEQNILSPSGTPSLIFKASNTITIDDVYVSNEADFASTSDKTEIPTMFQHLMVLYATHCGLVKSKRPAAAQMIMEIYNNEIAYLRNNAVEVIPNGRNDLKAL